VLFGILRNSVGHSKPKWDGYTVEVEVGVGLGKRTRKGAPDPSTTYARRLEYGGADSRGVMILPRPYLEPSVQQAQVAMDKILNRIGS
jgi:hypothetical protein